MTTDMNVEYDVSQFVPQPNEELICAICQNVLWHPRQCPCDHVFCHRCITTWLKEKPLCPVCRGRIRSSQLKPVLPLLQNLILKLTLACKYAGNGCSESLTLESYHGHLNTCGYQLMLCGNVGCGEEVLRKNLSKHKAKCEYNKIQCCGWCKFSMPVSESRNHSCQEAALQRIKELEAKTAEQEDMIASLLNSNSQLHSEVKHLTDQVNMLQNDAASSSAGSPFSSAMESFWSEGSVESDNYSGASNAHVSGENDVEDGDFIDNDSAAHSDSGDEAHYGYFPETIPMSLSISTHSRRKRHRSPTSPDHNARKIPRLNAVGENRSGNSGFRAAGPHRPFGSDFAADSNSGDDDDDDDDDWELSARETDSTDSLSDNSDDDSQHHVYVPKTTHQLLDEYASCDSDDSWCP